MESKKINQLATSVAPQTSDLTIIGDPITGVSKKITLLQIANLFATTGTVTSVAVTETGDALTITGSPITSAGTINIGFAGDATQYVRGDGALADFPTSTGGGSSVSYYLNSSVSQGTIGGVAYREFSKDPISGAGTDITASTNGYIASYITDANDPALLEVPAGNFNCELYFSVNSNNHNPYVYAEVYKYDGTTFTLIGSSQSVPEYLTNGTTLSPYYFAIPVTQTTLAITDRIAIRIYVNVDGRTVTLHTENNHLCQVVTTFSKGLTSLNNLTRQVQFLATGTSGTDFNISSSTATHTFNLPVASATNTGKLSSTDWSTFNNKQPAIGYTPANDSLVVHLAGSETITGDKTFDGNNVYNGVNIYNTYQTRFTAGIAINQTLSGGAVGSHTVIGANVNGLNVNFPAGGYNSLNFASTSVGNTYTFPNATGTLALTSDISYPVTSVFGRTGAVVAASGDYTTTQVTEGTNLYYTEARVNANTNVAANTAARHNAVTIGTANGLSLSTQVLSLALASTSANGALSSTDWNTFNGKQAALNGTGFVKISGTTISYDNSTYLTTSAAASTYLALSGGTLTGALNGTSATFSGNMAIGSSTTALSPLQVVATGTIVRLGEQSGTTGKQFLIGIDATSGRSELQSVWQGTGFTSLALQPSGGNVLIGTTGDNGAKLQVSGSATFSSNVNIQDNSVLNLGYNQGGGATLKYNSNGNLDITPRSGYNSIFTAGNVGIGTSSPAWKLQIGDGTGTGNQFLRMFSSACDMYIGQHNSLFSLGTIQTIVTDSTYTNPFVIGTLNGSAPLVFGTNGTERMRILGSIDGTASVLIGNTSSNWDTANRGTLEINGTNTSLLGLKTGGSPKAYFYTTGTDTYINNEVNGGKIFCVAFSAGVYLSTGATSWTANSDERLKNIKGNIENAIEKLMTLRPVNFSWKSDNDNKENLGLIAQDVEKVFPQVIDKNKLPTNANYEQLDETEYLGVRYQELVPVLIKAIQEQQVQIEELKAKIK